MKLSKQERIFIIVFIVAAIIGVGFFLSVLPNFNQIEVNQKNLDTKKKELADKQQQVLRLDTIDADIMAEYEAGKDLADAFYVDLTPVDADEIIRQYIAKGKDITIEGLDISPFTTKTLGISVFTETEVTYPLKDFANTSGKDEEDEAVDFEALETREKIMYAKKLEALRLASSEPVTVGSINVTFDARSDKLENLHALVDILNDGLYNEDIKDRKATYMSAIEYELPDKSGAENKEDQQTGTENPDAGNTNVGTGDGQSHNGYKMTFSVDFYCIKPVEKPVLTTVEG